MVMKLIQPVALMLFRQLHEGIPCIQPEGQWLKKFDMHLMPFANNPLSVFSSLEQRLDNLSLLIVAIIVVTMLWLHFYLFFSNL